MPRFSVVIPLWNKREGISRALTSVQAAAGDVDLEIIVVNDGSTDGSDLIAREMAREDDRIRVIDQRNGGVSAARNTGARQARADHLLLLDADDAWMEDHVAEISALVDRFPEAALYGTAYLRQTGGVHFRPDFFGVPASPEMIPSYFLSMSYGAMPISSSSVCVPKRTFDACGGFRTDLSHGEDRAFWAEASLHGAVAWSPKETSIYHLDAENRSTATWTTEKAKGYLRHLQDIRARILSGAIRPPASVLEMPLLLEHLEESMSSERYFLGRGAISRGQDKAAVEMIGSLIVDRQIDAVIALMGGRLSRSGQMPVAFPSRNRDRLVEEMGHRRAFFDAYLLGEKEWPEDPYRITHRETVKADADKEDPFEPS